MFRSMHICLFRTGLILLAGLGFLSIAHAVDFSVENRVYSGNDADPASHSNTIFQEGVVYDFLKDPAEIVVFVKPAGRFVLLDETRKIRCELTTNEIDTFTQKLRDRAVKQKDPLIRFLAEPVFEERFDKIRHELTLTSDLVNYRAIVTSAENAAMANEYREFSDWYARLNALLTPGARPPYARLKLNEAIARHETIAREVIFSVTSLKGGKRQTTTFRSEHNLSNTLTPTDMERVESAKQAMIHYNLVPFEKYSQSK
jgi:hypothetical protein